MLMYFVCMLLWLWHTIVRKSLIEYYILVKSHKSKLIRDQGLTWIDHRETVLPSKNWRRRVSVPQLLLPWSKVCWTIRRKVFLPVMLSHRILDVIILPYGLNNASRSCCVMFFGSPDTYRFAPFIASELGLAYETCN